MSKLPIVERLLFRADAGDMGREPDPTCTLRHAATTITELVSALDDALNTNPGWVERAQAILSAVRGETP